VKRRDDQVHNIK